VAHNAFATADAPLVIGVLGDNPFGNALHETVEGETVNGHKVVVRHMRRPEEMRGCHLVFVSRSEKNRLPQIEAAASDTPLVLASDLDQFARQSGAFGFVLLDNKVRFEINLAAARRGGVKISSKLLKLAVAVYGITEEGGAAP
jgi:hypothetical protein